VRDHRVLQIEKMPNVTLYRDSGPRPRTCWSWLERVVLATGATWRRDGYGHSHWVSLPA
jgi:dimethylamine/trimethylamine dehydrogenase